MPRLTLRPSDRLKRREEFRRVQDTGKKHHTRHFLVVVLPRVVVVGPDTVVVDATVVVVSNTCSGAAASDACQSLKDSPGVP